jgi:hypothetical protein
MVATAVVAATLGWMAERHARFRRLAAQHKAWTFAYPRFPTLVGSSELSWHEEMRRKYERAARYPWLPVGPDPP